MKKTSQWVNLHLNLLEAHEFWENLGILFFKGKPDHLFDVSLKLFQALDLGVTPSELRNFSDVETVLIFLDHHKKFSTCHYISLLFRFLV